MLFIIGVTLVVGVLSAIFLLIWWLWQDRNSPEKDRRFGRTTTKPSDDGPRAENGPDSFVS